MRHSARRGDAGGQNVCYQLATGSTLTTEANKLLSAPHNYWTPSPATSSAKPSKVQARDRT